MTFFCNHQIFLELFFAFLLSPLLAPRLFPNCGCKGRHFFQTCKRFVEKICKKFFDFSQNIDYQEVVLGWGFGCCWERGGKGQKRECKIQNAKFKIVPLWVRGGAAQQRGRLLPSPKLGEGAVGGRGLSNRPLKPADLSGTACHLP